MVGSMSAKDGVDVTIHDNPSSVPDDGLLSDGNEVDLTTSRALDLIANLQPCPTLSGGKSAVHDEKWETTPYSHFRDSQAGIPQPWLYGQTSLKKTGQIICAELEVAILCMQKRLGKVIISAGSMNKHHRV